MNVTVIGGRGLVGSAFVRLLKDRPEIRLRVVTRETYATEAGVYSDLVIDASGNSRKFIADDRPLEDMALTVEHRLRTLLDFPAGLHVHVSSVDVYPDLTSPESTREDQPIDGSRSSHYGFHKLLAEELVRHYAPRWLIVRLAGMVGPGLRKNPVFDVLHGNPIRIHPDSEYQFMHTDDVARIVWHLVERGIFPDVVNVVGEGLISVRGLAAMAGLPLNASALNCDIGPRIVHASTARLRCLMPVPSTRDAVSTFVRGWPDSGRASS